MKGALRMAKLGSELMRVIRALDGDAAKFMSIARNNMIYREAVEAIWSDREASQMILDGTNGLYVRRDDAPRKGPGKDEPYIVCTVCAADALIRAELDTHRELLQLRMRQLGMQMDEVRIVPARRGMKDRHPFRDA